MTTRVNTPRHALEQLRGMFEEQLERRGGYTRDLREEWEYYENIVSGELSDNEEGDR